MILPQLMSSFVMALASHPELRKYDWVNDIYFDNTQEPINFKSKVNSAGKNVWVNITVHQLDNSDIEIRWDAGRPGNLLPSSQGGNLFHIPDYITADTSFRDAFDELVYRTLGDVVEEIDRFVKLNLDKITRTTIHGDRIQCIHEHKPYKCTLKTRFPDQYVLVDIVNDQVYMPSDGVLTQDWNTEVPPKNVAAAHEVLGGKC